MSVPTVPVTTMAHLLWSTAAPDLVLCSALQAARPAAPTQATDPPSAPGIAGKDPQAQCSVGKQASQLKGPVRSGTRVHINGRKHAEHRACWRLLKASSDLVRAPLQRHICLDCVIVALVQLRREAVRFADHSAGRVLTMS